MLSELLETNVRQFRVLVSGDRGVGKSILTRKVVAEFALEHQDQVVAVVVDGRAIGFRRFLKDLGIQMVERLRDRLDALEDEDTRASLGRWLDELSLVVSYDEIAKAQVDALERKYGAQGEVGSSLFEVLKLGVRFLWEETRRHGQ